MRQSHSGAIKAGVSLGVLLVTLLGCASSGTPIDRDIELVVVSSIESTLASHKPTLPVSAELVALDGTVTIDHKRNLGRIDTSEHQLAFHWQADGRLASTSVGTFRSPNGTVITWTSTSSTLCGLVTLLTESASNSDSRLTTAIPAGAVFVPFGFSSKSQSASRARIASFSTSASNLCMPTAGTSFTYKSTREVQRKFEGSMISSNRLHTITESATCTAGPTELPAKTLNPSFLGNYLPVSCSYSEPSKSVRKADFAYLISSSMYVPISIQPNEYQTDSTRYTALRYSR